MKKTILILNTVFLILFVLPGCDKPELVPEGEESCAGGLSILSVDDSEIPDDIRDLIYQPNEGSDFINTTHPDYNASGKTVIIPFSLTDLPWNTAISADVIEASYFRVLNGSFSDYFRENSYGQFFLNNAGISDVVSLPYSYADWVALDNPVIFTTAMNLSSINWDELDENGDNIISPNEAQIVFIYPFGGSGAVRTYSLDIVTNYGSFTVNNNFALIDVKRNDDPEKDVNPIMYNSAAVHELCHAFFNLPDRYGIDGICGEGETGPYDLMSASCNWVSMTAFDKMKIGWLQPKILEISTLRESGVRECLTFPASESIPAALVLWSSEMPEEFFIVENKNSASGNFGFENLPENGLAIWWSPMVGNNLHLVNFKKLDLNPQDQTYYDYSGPGVLFSYNMDYTALDIIPLRNSDGIARFFFRAISVPGENMYGEL